MNKAKGKERRAWGEGRKAKLPHALRSLLCAKKAASPEAAFSILPLFLFLSPFPRRRSF